MSVRVTLGRACVGMILFGAFAGCASAPASGAGAGAAAGGGPAAVADSSGRRTRAMEQRLLEEARPTPPSVRLRITAFETFVPGNTRAEFLEKVNDRRAENPGFQRGAQRPMSTHWRMTWSWEQKIEGNTCVFRTVTVFIDYQTHFVRLAGPIADDPVIQEWWNGETERSFASRLFQLKQLRNAAGDTQKKLRSMFSGNCEMLAREASMAANRDVQDLGDRMNAQVLSDPPAA